MSSYNKNLVSIYGLSASEKLTNDICRLLNVDRDPMKIIRFADGEILARAMRSVRGKDVYLIQSTSNPVNEMLMELLIAIDALKRGSARSINVVVPYFGYARQDRKAKGRQPITCKLVANMLTGAGATRIMTIDLHSPQSMGFFDVPVDDLHTSQQMSKCILNIIKNEKINEEVTVVSPDHGGLIRAREISDQLGHAAPNIAVIDKRRPKPNVAEIEFVLGDVKDKICFIVDDMIDTGGTITQAAKALKKHGAKKVYIIATHGVLSDPACSRLSEVIEAGVVERVILTNTIDIPKEKIFKGLEIINIAPMVVDMIKAIVESRSLSDVYTAYNDELSLAVKKDFKKIK
ncbi:ribose-phosphate pyrophosphokinase [Spiroplasma endosymbiont of Anurida maritima]|uniref:ribose-phosphate diphosphokinase n=1 Tax=Spiroplasma endosymbiont of Anurida maritima TaxID=2967972 RepID=UPI0036D42F14